MKIIPIDSPLSMEIMPSDEHLYIPRSEAASNDHSDSADYHMTQNNDNVTLQYGDDPLPIPPGAWYGWDEHTGEAMAWFPDDPNTKWYEKDMVTGAEVDFAYMLEQKGTWVRAHKDTGEWLSESTLYGTVIADGIKPLGIKSFDEWLESCYGLSHDTYERYYYGQQAQNIIDRYKLYAYGPLPKFANTPENLNKVPLPTIWQNERADFLIGTHKGGFQDIVKNTIFMHNDLENNYNAFLDASIKMKELYSAEEKEAEILKYAMRTSHSFRDWDAIEKMHKDAESVLDGSTCNSAYLPKNLRNLIERAMEGQWTQEMTDIVQKATTYLGHADNNDTPEMTEATIAASEIIRKAIAFSHDNDNYCSKEFETARTRINGAYFSELKLTIDAFLEGEKDLYVKAREAGIDKEFCVRNLICLDASNVDKWEHEFENAAKEDITYE